MPEIKEGMPSRLREFERLESDYRSSSDWTRLAQLYLTSASKAADQRTKLQHLLQAGGLFRDQLKASEKAQDCFNQAISILTAWIDQTSDPLSKSDLLCDLAKIYYEVVRDREKAIATYVRAFELDHQKTHLMSILGDIYAEKKGWTDVISKFQDEARGSSDPSLRAKYLSEIADIYSFVLADPDRALKTYEEILRMDPTNRKAVEAVENLFIKKRRWSDLAGLYEQLEVHLSEADEIVSLNTKLGMIYRDKLLKPLKAITAYEKILALQPTNFRIRSKIEELRADRTLWEKQVSTLADSLAAQKEPAARTPLLLEQAAIARDFLNDSELALQLATEALRHDPADEGALAIAVPIWEKTSQWANIVFAFERAADTHLSPQAKVRALRSAARYAIDKLDDRARAIGALENLTALVPDDQEAFRVLDELYESQSLWEPLERLLSSGVVHAASAAKPSILLRLAKIREEQISNSAGAIEAYEQLLQVDSHHPDALEALERLYPAERRWRDLVKIISLRADQATSQAEKGRLYALQARTLEEKVGDLREAVRAYERASPLLDHPTDIFSRMEQIYFNERLWEDMAQLYQRRVARSSEISERNRLLFKLAELMEQKLNQPVKAEECLMAILARSPKDLPALRKLQVFYETQENWTKLVEVLDRTSDASDEPDEKISVTLKAADICAKRLEDADRAEQVYRRILALDPANAVSLNFLSAYYRERNQPENLLHILETHSQIIKDPQPLSRIHFEIGQLFHVSLGRERDAIREYERALELDPTFQSAREALAKLYETRERWEDLVRTYIGDLDQTKDRLKGADLTARVGRLYLNNLASPEKAVTYLERSYDLSASHIAVLRDLVSALEKVKDVPKLTSYLAKLLDATESVEEKTNVSLRLGTLVEADARDSSQAIRWYESALRFDPASKTAFERLTHLYESTGDWTRLISTLERMLTATSKEQAAEVHFQIGKLYETRLTRPDLALISYQIAVERRPDFVDPLRAMRTILREDSNWGEYLRATRAEADITAEPHRKSELIFEVGTLWRERFSQVDKAIASFEEILTMFPKHAQAWEQLSKLFFEKNDLSAAYRATEEALALIHEPKGRLLLLERCAELERSHRNDLEAASVLLREVLSIEPDRLPAIKALVEVCEGLRDWKGKLSALQMQLEVEETPAARAGALFEIAKLWNGPLKSRENATETLLGVLRIDPGNDAALRFLGTLTTEAGQWQKIIRQISKLLIEKAAWQEVSNSVLIGSEVFQTQLQHPELAVSVLEEAISNIPENEWDAVEPILNSMVELQRKLGDHQAIVSLLERRARSAPEIKDRANALLEASELLAGPLNQPKNALNLLNDARDLVPNRRLVVDRLIDLSLRLSDWKAADGFLLEAIASEAVTSERGAELRFQRAMLLVERIKDPEAARDLLNELVAALPDHKPSLQVLADLHSAASEWKEVAAIWEKLLRLERGTASVDLHRQLALLYQERLHDLPQAAAHLEAVHRVTPKDKEVLGALANIYRESADFTNLTHVLQLQIPLSPDTTQAAQLYKKLGDVFLKDLNQPERAIDAFERSLQKDPTQQEVLNFLIQTYETSNRPQELSEVLLRKSQTCSPQESIPVLEKLADVWLRSLSNPVKALEILERILKIDPNHRVVLKSIAKIHEGNENFRAQAWALGRLADTASDREERRDLLLSMGVTQMDKLGERHESIETFRKVLTLEAENRLALDRLRFLLTRDEQWADLAQVLRTVSEQAKSDLLPAILRELAALEIDRLHNPKAAIRTLEELFRIEPSDETLHRLESLYEQLGLYPPLVDLMERALSSTTERDPRLRILKRLGEICDDRLKKPDDSIRYFEEVLTLNPADLETLTRLESLYRASGRSDDAAKILEIKASFLPFDSERTRILEGLADGYSSSSRSDDAVRCLELLSEDENERLKALTRAFHLLEPNGDLIRLQKVVERIIEAVSNKSEKVPWLVRLGVITRQESPFLKALNVAPHHTEAVDALREFYRNHKLFEKAAPFLEEEAKAAQDPHRGVELMKELAEIYRSNLNDSSKAIQVYENLVRISPHEMEAVTILANIYFERGDWKEVAPLLDRLVKVSTSRKSPQLSANLFYRLGVATRNLNRADEAVLHFTQALSYDPDNPEAIRALSDLYYSLGQWDNALASLRKCISIESADNQTHVLQLYYKLLQTLDRLGQDAEALRIYEEASDHLAQHVGSMKIAARLYYKLGKNDEAFQTYEKLLSIASLPTEQQAARYAIAEIALHRFKNPRQSREYISVILQEDPGHKKAQELFLELCEAEKEWPDAISALMQLIQLETQPQTLSLLHCRLGSIYDREIGDLRKARDAYLRSIELSHGDTPAIQALENLSRTDSDWKELSTLYERTASALKKQGAAAKASNFWIALGLLKRDRLKDPNGAIDAFRNAASMDPKSDEALLRLAQTLSQTAKGREEAHKLFFELLHRSSENLNVLKEAALFLEGHGDSGSALVLRNVLFALDAGGPTPLAEGLPQSRRIATEHLEAFLPPALQTPMAKVFRHLGEDLVPLFATGRRSNALLSATEVVPGTTLTQIAKFSKALGLDPKKISTYFSTTIGEIELELSSPAALGVGPGLYKIDSSEAEYLLAFQLSALFMGYRLLNGLTPEAREELLDALYALAMERPPRKEGSITMLQLLKRSLSKKQQSFIAEALAKESETAKAVPLNSDTLLAAFQSGTAILAFCLTGDIAAATRASKRVSPEVQRALVRFLTSPEYLKWRKQPNK